MCTLSCQLLANAAAQSRAIYTASWPAHCPTCGGTGAMVVPGEFVDWGATTTRSPDTAEPCSDCVLTDHCPRCGESGLAVTDQDAVCPACGWLDGAEGLPPEHECLCYLFADAGLEIPEF